MGAHAPCNWPVTTTTTPQTSNAGGAKWRQLQTINYQYRSKWLLLERATNVTVKTQTIDNNIRSVYVHEVNSVNIIICVDVYRNDTVLCECL